MHSASECMESRFLSHEHTDASGFFTHEHINPSLFLHEHTDASGFHRRNILMQVFFYHTNILMQVEFYSHERTEAIDKLHSNVMLLLPTNSAIAVIAADC